MWLGPRGVKQLQPQRATEPFCRDGGLHPEPPRAGFRHGRGTVQAITASDKAKLHALIPGAFALELEDNPHRIVDTAGVAQ